MSTLQWRRARPHQENNTKVEPQHNNYSNLYSFISVQKNNIRISSKAKGNSPGMEQLRRVLKKVVQRFLDSPRLEPLSPLQTRPTRLYTACGSQMNQNTYFITSPQTRTSYLTINSCTNYKILFNVIMSANTDAESSKLRRLLPNALAIRLPSRARNHS